MLKLREYQQDIVSDIRSLMRKGEKRILVCSPTGSGKTALTANMLGTSASKGMNSQFIVHRRELIKQSALAFDKADVFHGIIANGFPSDSRPLVQIASIQTLARRYHTQKRPKLIIWDECHHVAAGTWATIFNTYSDAFHIGLTATPERLDGKGLRKWFTTMVRGPSVQWLIDEGFLCNYRLYAPSRLSLEGVRTQMGDYNRTDIADAVDKPRITGSAVSEYRKVSYEKRAVVFCVSVQHSRHVVDEFNAAGFASVHVDGNTEMVQRDQSISRFADGHTKILSNVDLFGEGFDLPVADTAILLRPTQSLGLYLQQVGRVLRPVYAPGIDLSTRDGRLEAIARGPKPHATILDHVGNYERHGLPDEDRDWSLDGKRGREQKKESGIGVKVCDNCFAAQLPGKDKCEFCGHIFKKTPREVEQVDGELVEIDPSILQLRRKKEQAGAQTLEELTQLGIERGYKRPRMWAKHVFNARLARKLK